MTISLSVEATKSTCVRHHTPAGVECVDSAISREVLILFKFNLAWNHLVDLVHVGSAQKQAVDSCCSSTYLNNP